jgi:hypothetical protein
VNDPAYLVKSTEKKHLGSGPAFNCLKCNYKSMRKYDLMRHMEKVHAISYNCKNGKRNGQKPEDNNIITDSEEVDEFFRENKEIVRKRRPINCSLQDLAEDDTADENWKAKSMVIRVVEFSRWGIQN